MSLALFIGVCKEGMALDYALFPFLQRPFLQQEILLAVHSDEIFSVAL